MTRIPLLNNSYLASELYRTFYSWAAAIVTVSVLSLFMIALLLETLLLGEPAARYLWAYIFTGYYNWLNYDTRRARSCRPSYENCSTGTLLELSFFESYYLENQYTIHPIWEKLFFSIQKVHCFCCNRFGTRSEGLFWEGWHSFSIQKLHTSAEYARQAMVYRVFRAVADGRRTAIGSALNFVSAAAFDCSLKNWKIYIYVWTKLPVLCAVEIKCRE